MSGALAVSLGEVKAYLRIDGADDDAVLAGLVRTAAALCEAFTGQVLIREVRSGFVPSDGAWHRLTMTPVERVAGVFEIAGDGSEAAAEYEAEIDVSGDAWVRLTAAPDRRARVEVEAGIAADWNGLAEPLRQGIVRLTAHLFANRDAAGDAGPPAAVAALWRPWRRMRLS